MSPGLRHSYRQVFGNSVVKPTHPGFERQAGTMLSASCSLVLFVIVVLDGSIGLLRPEKPCLSQVLFALELIT